MIISSNIQEISDALESGGIVVFKTDTLYSLSCDASSNDAVSKIYKIKHRPIHKALPVFFDSIESIKRYVVMDDTSLKIAQKFWPGPLTLVLPLLEHSRISPLVHRHSRCVAVRIPNAPLLCNVMKHFGRPIIGTSANISGLSNTHSEQEIFGQFSDQVDACALDKDQEISHVHSTIIKLSGKKMEILREGHISAKKILKSL